MYHTNILSELYKVAKHESLLAAHIHDLEADLDSVLLLVGRFEFESATTMLSSLLLALQSFPPSVASLRLEAHCLTILGNICRDQGRIDGEDGAYMLYKRARDIWKHLGELHRVAWTTWYMGACNEMRRRYTEALKYYKESLDIVDVVGGAEILRSHILLRMGTVLTKSMALDEAEKTIYKSLSLLEKGGTSSNYAYTKQKLAIVHLSTGHVETALNEVIETLSIVSTTDKFRLTQTKILVTDLLFHIKEESSGMKMASEAEMLANEYGFNHQLSSLYDIINKYIT